MGIRKTLWVIFSIVAAVSMLPSLSFAGDGSSSTISGGYGCSISQKDITKPAPDDCPNGQIGTVQWNCGWNTVCGADPCQALSDKFDTANNSSGDKQNTLQNDTQSKMDKLQNSYNTTKADNDQKLQDILQKINEADAKHNEAIAKNTDAASKAAIDAQTNSDKLTLDLRKMNADLASAQGDVGTANANVAVVAAANSIDLIRLQCLAQINTAKNSTTSQYGGINTGTTQQGKVASAWSVCLSKAATAAALAIQDAQKAVTVAQGKVSVLQGQISAQTNAIALATQSAAASKNSLNTAQANELKQYNQNRSMLVSQYQTSSQNAQSSLQTIMSQENSTSMNAAQQAQRDPTSKQLNSLKTQMQGYGCCDKDAYQAGDACNYQAAQDKIDNTGVLLNATAQRIMTGNQ